MSNEFDLSHEMELIAEESKRYVCSMIRYADKRMLDRTWVLEQFRKAINEELSNDD